MKIMTMNTHSLAEPEFEKKREWFVQMVLRERPEVFALQEVNQTMEAPVLKADPQAIDGSLSGIPAGYVPCPGVTVPLKEDNYAAWLANSLDREGFACQWTWLPGKVGYDHYDEGMAIFSRLPIREARQHRISQVDDYRNWKTRKVLGIRTDGLKPTWYYTVHMGWWDDEEEPFETQWKVLHRHMKEQMAGNVRMWLLGDFNSPSHVRGQGYDCVKRDGWLDTYDLAREKDLGITVGHVIDGWRERTLEQESSKGMRLDYVFCSEAVPVIRSQVVCDGSKDPQVSDHYGVMIETENP